MKKKENTKLLKEQTKLENKRKRELKLKEKKEKATIPKKRQIKLKTSSLKNRNQRQLPIEDKENDGTKPKKIQINESTAESNASITRDERTETHVRHLFKTPEKEENNMPKDVIPENHVRDLFKTPEKEENNLPKNNILVRKGLCYICVKNMYLTNIGIKCQKCNRTYHVSCLKRKDLYKEYFLCSVCFLKIN